MRRSDDAERDARRVVAIQIERTGDLIVSTPALRNLRRSLPKAHITLVCRPETANVLRGWDAIDKIIAFDSHLPRDQQRRFIRNLAAGGLDLSVTLTTSRPAYHFTRQLGARRRGGAVYGANLIEALLARLIFTHPVRIWINEQTPEVVEHRVEELLDINAALGLGADRLHLEVPQRPADSEMARAWLASFGLTPGQAIVLHVGRGEADPRAHGKWLGDGWAAWDLVALARYLQRLVPAQPLVLTAGREDAEAVAVLEGVVGFEARATRSEPLAGRGTTNVSVDGTLVLAREFDFHLWAALLREAAVIVTPNTAAVHLASAVGRPVVAVYPAARYDVNSREWAPWMVPCRVLKKDEPARTIADVIDAAWALFAPSVRDDPRRPTTAGRSDGAGRR